MDFKDQIKQLGERIVKLKDSVLTEEATKNAFIMPFLQVLGYDVFNPFEVSPEKITDVGIKKGEKIDYAILKDGQPIMLIECKHHAQPLNLHSGQLLRYFHVSKAKFGLLTNGIVYRFYSDLVVPNRMDEKPFLEVNLTEIKDNQIEELKKFHKSYFDEESITATASELKYMNELKNLIAAEFNNPTENFIKHFTKQVYPSVITQKIFDQFSILTKKAIHQYTSELITDRLKSALTKEETKSEPKETETENPSTPKIITTSDEMEAFWVIKSIIRNKVDSNRIAYRDAQSYFSLLLDDNNRKPICRIYMNGKKKQIGIFDHTKAENKFEINKVDDIYSLAEQLTSSLNQYLDSEN